VWWLQHLSTAWSKATGRNKNCSRRWWTRTVDRRLERTLWQRMLDGRVPSIQLHVRPTASHDVPAQLNFTHHASPGSLLSQWWPVERHRRPFVRFEHRPPNHWQKTAYCRKRTSHRPRFIGSIACRMIWSFRFR